jgi:hypothetical protein
MALAIQKEENHIALALVALKAEMESFLLIIGQERSGSVGNNEKLVPSK